MQKNGSSACWTKGKRQLLFTPEEVVGLIDDESFEVMLDSESDDESEQVGDYCDADGQEALVFCELLCQSSQTIIELLQDGPPLDAVGRDSILLDMNDSKPTINQLHWYIGYWAFMYMSSQVWYRCSWLWA